MAIQFELYKTPHPKDEENKETYHARVVNFQHIDTDYPVSYTHLTLPTT